MYYVKAIQSGEIIFRSERLTDAIANADDFKVKTKGRNAEVVKTEQVYVTTTLEEALAESKAVENEPIMHIQV